MSNNLHTLAADVATELGNDWTATPGTHEGAVTLSDGTVSLFGRVNSYGADAGRVSWSVAYPDGHAGHLRYDERGDARATTTTAPDRTPRAIALQLTRNLLPTARKWAPILAERDSASNDAAAMRAQAFEQVQRIFPGAHTRSEDFSGDISLYPAGPWHGHISLYHSADRATVELHGLPWDVVTKILALAAEVR